MKKLKKQIFGTVRHKCLLKAIENVEKLFPNDIA